MAHAFHILVTYKKITDSIINCIKDVCLCEAYYLYMFVLSNASQPSYSSISLVKSNGPGVFSFFLQGSSALFGVFAEPILEKKIIT